MYNPKSLANLRNQNSEPSVSVSAVPVSSCYIDNHLSLNANLSELITNDSPDLETFCSIDPRLERQRIALVARNHELEVVTARERERKLLRQRGDIVSAVLDVMNTIQNTRKRITR